MHAFETKVALVSVDDSGLAIVRVKGGLTYRLDEVVDHYVVSFGITGSLKVAALVDAREVRYTDVTGEVLRYMADNEYVPLMLANALLVSSPSLRMVANLYLELFHPRVPTRIFTDESKAIDWLKERLAGQISASASK
jgi:hypothetical protein